MSKQFQYDVFLSHNHQDKPRVRRLAEQLRAAGLRVWLDEWVIQPGDDIYLAIERGLDATRVLLLCLSPNALGSDWVALERSTAIHRDPSNAGRRFIPLLLADCELPDTLRRYKYVDFREEAEAAFAELLSACRIPTEEVSAGSMPTPGVWQMYTKTQADLENIPVNMPPFSGMMSPEPLPSAYNEGFFFDVFWRWEYNFAIDKTPRNSEGQTGPPDRLPR